MSIVDKRTILSRDLAVDRVETQAVESEATEMRQIVIDDTMQIKAARGQSLVVRPERRVVVYAERRHLPSIRIAKQPVSLNDLREFRTGGTKGLRIAHVCL